MYQKWLPRFLATYVPYIGGAVAVVSLAALAFNQGVEIFRRLTWTDKLIIGDFNSMARSAFLNVGDGDVYITSLEVIYPNHFEGTVRVAQLAKKGDLTIISPIVVPNNTFLMDRDGVVSAEMEQLIGNPCLALVYMSPGDPERMLVERHYAELFKAKPIKAPMDIYVNFVSLHTGKPSREKLDVATFVGLASTPECQQWAKDTGISSTLPPPPPNPLGLPLIERKPPQPAPTSQ